MTSLRDAGTDTFRTSLLVQKYGGSSLAKPEQIKSAAQRIAKLHRTGHRLIIVVSAMGKTTDDLVRLAYQTSSTPNRRELDMLLSTGERVSMSLMSMALTDCGVPAISFTGSQAGVFTDDQHANAQITDLRPTRVAAELARGQVVVLAGFQGVSPQTKEITTLGRGGSDTTAVAMAAHFQAERCEILKDVDGVYSADPNSVASARHLPVMSYDALLEMTFWGAKVLHYRSVELAARRDVPLLIGLAHDDGDAEGGFADDASAGGAVADGTVAGGSRSSHRRHTLITRRGNEMYESEKILAVNSHAEVRSVVVESSDLAEGLTVFGEALTQAKLPMPQFLRSACDGKRCDFVFTAPSETLQAICQTLQLTKAKFSLDERLFASATATCQGAHSSHLHERIARALAGNGVVAHGFLFSAMSVTVLIASADRTRAVAVMHDLIGDE